MSDRWNQLQDLFLSALEFEGNSREQFVSSACADDHALRNELQSLLEHAERADHFMEQPAAGGDIGPYRLVKVLASGGMGTVYQAEQRNPRRSVALKVIRTGGYDDQQRVRLFKREAESLARLKHPGIAAIHEAGCTPSGQHFLAMELVHGESITEFVKGRDLTIRQKLALFGQVCDAVGYAHQRGVIHRDIKPSNILVTDPQFPTQIGSSHRHGAVVKVLDFGIARIIESESGPDTTITSAGQIMGTLRYMSPEQASGRNDEIDTRTDIYSLGVVLYEVLTGQLPYLLDSAAPHDAIRRICEDAPVRPRTIRHELRGDLETILLKALEKDPQQRYQSVPMFADDIERLLSNQPILAHPPSSLYQFRKLVARHKTAFTAASALVILVIAFGVTASLMAKRLAAQRQVAVDASLNEAAARRVSEQIAGFMDHMISSARPEFARGGELTVREAVDESAARVAVEFADQPRIAAALHGTIGRTYHSLGLNTKAEHHLTRALALATQVYGQNDPTLVPALHGLAKLRIDQGRHDAAKELCDRALAITRTNDGTPTADFASSMDVYATLLRAQGDFDAAKMAFAEVVEIRRTLDDGRDPQLGSALNNLASVAHAQANYDEAESLYREALDLQHDRFGERHPDYVTTLNNLAMLLWERGDYDGAAPLFDRVAAIQRVLFDNLHPLVAASLNNLGLLRKAQRRFTEARELLEEALAMQRQTLSPNHPDLASTMNNLGGVWYAIGDYARAEPLFRDALSIRRIVYSEDHPDLAQNLNDLAAVNYAQGKLDDAESLYRESLEMYLALVGPDHPRVGASHNNLGSLYRKRGRLGDARRHYEEALRIFELKLPDNHPYFGGPLVGLGTVLRDLNQPGAAEPLLRRGAAALRRSFPENHWRVVQCDTTLGACLISLKRYEDAEAILMAALEASKNAETLPPSVRTALATEVHRLKEVWPKTNAARNDGTGDDG